MSEVINSLHAVRRGNKWYVSGGGGAGSPIHTFNSVDEMNAANLADGSIACVPSSGESGGAKVIDLEDEKYGEFSANLLSIIFVSSGGAIRVLDGENTNDLILAECNTEQPLVFKFGGTMGDMALKVESRTVNKAYINGSLMQVAFSAMMYYEGVIIDFTISFMYDATALSITKTPTTDYTT